MGKKLISIIVGGMAASPGVAASLTIIFHPRHDWQWQTDLHVVLAILVIAIIAGGAAGALVSSFID